MPALGAAEPQDPGDRVQHLRRDGDVPALLQPLVPGRADPGEDGDLLAAQARGAAAAAVGQARLGGVTRARRLRRKSRRSWRRRAVSGLAVFVATFSPCSAWLVVRTPR